MTFNSFFYRNTLLFVVFCLIIIHSSTYAQHRHLEGGYGPGSDPTHDYNLFQKQQTSGLIQSTFDVTGAVFTTTVYTFDDIVVFSYFDDTEILVVNAEGDTIATEVLTNNGHLAVQQLPAGIYSVMGSKSFSVLIGDALTESVQGYFAVDQGGLGTSTLLNTYMMQAYLGTERFIVFSYEDGTQFTIRDLQTDELIHAGVLNADQHFTMPQTPHQKFLQVQSSNPVSVLCYADTDYYVPSSTGLFSGTYFLGYSAYYGNWTNSITVTAYHDNTDVLVTNLETGDTLAVYTLDEGQVHSHPITTPTYWRVETTNTVTAANIPFVNWTANYAYLARAMDRDGLGAGNLFYIPAIGGRLDVFSFDDDNVITITNLGDYESYPYLNPQIMRQDTLNAGGHVMVNTPSGRNVYKVESSGYSSAIQSFSGWGASFMSLRHSLELPNIAISQRDIILSKKAEEMDPGDEVEILMTVHNLGQKDADNVIIHMYSGKNPEQQRTAPLIAKTSIPKIPALDKEDAKLKFIVPQHPEYRDFSIVIDPENHIIQSNSLNNKVNFPLIPNQDFEAPLSVSIDAPPGLLKENGVLTPNPFTITADIFNIGNDHVDNVVIELVLQDGLELASGDAVVTITQLGQNSHAEISWEILADTDVPGYNKYRIDLEADDMEPKTVKRSINIPGSVIPATTENLSAAAVDGATDVQLTWPLNTENDLAGYYIYYGTESGNYNGTGADQGDSPIVISTFETYKITGLEEATQYFFAISAFNTAGMESALSNEVMVITTSAELTNTNIPDEYALLQNYPNPFNPSTTIRFALPSAGEVRLVLYDLLGRQVATLIAEHRQAGYHDVVFDGGQLSSGVYIYQIRAGDFVETKRLMLIK